VAWRWWSAVAVMAATSVRTTADRSAPPAASGSSGNPSAGATRNLVTRTAAAVIATGRRAAPGWTRASG